MRAVPHGLILFISEPPDDNARCEEHPNGCGLSLNVSDIVMVDGSEMEMINGEVVNFAVRKLNHLGVRQCKVGLMRALPGQTHLFGNRVGVVSEIKRRVGDTIQSWSEPGQSSPTETKVPRKETSIIKSESKPAAKPRATKKSKRNDVHISDPNDKTREIVKDCRGIAIMTFIDGGGNTNVPPKTRQGVTFEISNGSVNRPEMEMDDNALSGVTHAPSAEVIDVDAEESSLESKSTKKRGRGKR